MTRALVLAPPSVAAVRQARRPESCTRAPTAAVRREDVMDVVHPRCCGLDVHKQTVVACILLASPSGPPQKLVRTFGTLTDELLALGDWLTSETTTMSPRKPTGPTG